MLVIGIKSDNTHASKTIEIDIDTDSPRKIHDALKAATDGALYCSIICIEDDREVAVFLEYEDYDLADETEEVRSNDDDEDGSLKDEEELDTEDPPELDADASDAIMDDQEDI